MKVKIGNLKYEIVNCGREFELIDNSWAFCDNQECKIYLSNKITKQYKTEVLLHELIHVFAAYLDLRLSERNTNLLAKILTLFLQENKQFVQKLLKEV